MKAELLILLTVLLTAKETQVITLSIGNVRRDLSANS